MVGQFIRFGAATGEYLSPYSVSAPPAEIQAIHRTRIGFAGNPRESAAQSHQGKYCARIDTGNGVLTGPGRFMSFRILELACERNIQVRQDQAVRPSADKCPHADRDIQVEAHPHQDGQAPRTDPDIGLIGLPFQKRYDI